MKKKKKKKPPPTKPKRYPVLKKQDPKRYPISKKNVKLKKFADAAVKAVADFDLEAVSKDGEMGRDLIRIMAGQYYAANLNQCSIKEMESHPIFSVARTSLEKWSRLDRWVERRMEFQETIRHRVQKVLVSEVVQIQMDQLKDLQGLFDKLFRKVFAAVDKVDVETASLPALINAVVKLAELLHEWRLSLGEMVAPKMSFDGKESTVKIPVKPDLSFEETRAAAKYLIKLKREQIRHGKKTDVQKDSTENMEDVVKDKLNSEISEGQ